MSSALTRVDDDDDEKEPSDGPLGIKLVLSHDKKLFRDYCRRHRRTRGEVFGLAMRALIAQERSAGTVLHETLPPSLPRDPSLLLAYAERVAALCEKSPRRWGRLHSGLATHLSHLLLPSASSVAKNDNPVSLAFNSTDDVITNT